MIKRPEHQQPIHRSQPESHHMVHALPIEIVIAVRDALRSVGRARRVHKAEQVFGPARRHRRRSEPLRNKVTAVVLGLRIEHDHLSQVRRSSGEFGVGKKQLSAGVFHDMPRFLCREAEIDWQKHAADMADRESDLKKRDGVLHEDRNYIAGPDPCLEQQCRDLSDPIGKLAVTDTLVPINYRKTIRRHAGVIGDEGAQIDHGT